LHIAYAVMVVLFLIAVHLESNSNVADSLRGAHYVEEAQGVDERTSLGKNVTVPILFLIAVLNRTFTTMHDMAQADILHTILHASRKIPRGAEIVGGNTFTVIPQQWIGSIVRNPGFQLGVCRLAQQIIGFHTRTLCS